MRFSKSFVVLACVVGAMVSACSGSDSETADPISLDEFPQAYANAVCDTLGPCCKAANVTYLEAGCKTAATDSATRQIAAGSIGHTRYDADAAGRCVAALKKAAASCMLTDNAEFGCRVFRGTIPLGGACATYQDCAEGDCHVDNTGLDTPAQGVCVAQPMDGNTAKAGEPCNTSCSGSSCERVAAGQGGTCYASDGLSCDLDTLVCVPLAKIGDACSTSGQGGGCVSGAYCKEGTCAQQSDSGSCEGSPDACSSKSYCDLGQCFAKKQDHLGCTSEDECESGFCVDLGGIGQRSCGVPPPTPSLCSGTSGAPQQ